MKQLRSAEIWYINDKYYLRAYSITVTGLGYSLDNPVHIISKQNIHDIGLEILNTLGECRFNIPQPSFNIKKENKIITMSGLKSIKEVMKRGIKIGVSLEEERLSISKWYFDGKGMSSTASDDIFCSLDPSDITKKVLEAFEQCHP